MITCLGTEYHHGNPLSGHKHLPLCDKMDNGRVLWERGGDPALSLYLEDE